MKIKQIFKKRILPITIIIIIINIFLLFVSPSIAEVNYLGYGANKMVSGSFHLIEICGEKIILDVGSFYEDINGNNPKLPKNITENVTAIILSHAHSDHTGRLLKIHKLGYQGPIYCSKPSYKLLPVMLKMSASFGDFGKEKFIYSYNSLKKNQQKGYNTVAHKYECKWASKIVISNRRNIYISRNKLASKGLKLCEVCVKQEVDKIMEQIIILPLSKVNKISESLDIQFFYTPHIPGSVSIKISSRTGSNESLIYSGDLGSGVSPFLKEQQTIESGDYLIVEGTYGTNVYEKKADEREKLQKYIGEKIKNNKRVIIPAFVLDRSQQVLYEILQGKLNGFIPFETPVKLFSPTAYDITKIYDRDFKTEKYNDFFSENFFSQKQLTEILTWADYGSPDIRKGDIVVCSSGMAETGFAKSFIEKYIEDQNSVFIFVGYQSPETIGGSLTSGKKDIYISKNNYQVNAEIIRFNCFSSHADFNQIKSFIEEISGLKKVLLVHTEEYNELISKYNGIFPEIEFIVPNSGEKIYLSD